MLYYRQELKANMDTLRVAQSDLTQQKTINTQLEGQISANEKITLSMKQEISDLQVLIYS